MHPGVRGSTRVDRCTRTRGEADHELTCRPRPPPYPKWTSPNRTGSWASAPETSGRTTCRWCRHARGAGPVGPSPSPSPSSRSPPGAASPTTGPRPAPCTPTCSSRPSPGAHLADVVTVNYADGEAPPGARRPRLAGAPVRPASWCPRRPARRPRSAPSPGPRPRSAGGSTADPGPPPAPARRPTPAAPSPVPPPRDGPPTDASRSEDRPLDQRRSDQSGSPRWTARDRPRPGSASGSVVGGEHEQRPPLAQPLGHLRPA